MPDKGQNNIAQELRDGNEDLFDVMTLRNQDQILVTVRNSHNKAIYARLYGAGHHDPLMADKVIDTRVELAIGSGTEQNAAIISSVQWRYIRVGIISTGGSPTTGDADVVIKVERKR